MTDENKMRRIEDRLPGEPLKWEEPQIADWRPYHSALSRCAELLDNMKDGDPITDVPDFLAAKLKQCRLASQSQAAQPSIKTWRERMEADRIGVHPAMYFADAEIAELRAHLAGQSQATKVQAVLDLHAAIMNIKCDVENCILGGAAADMAYKLGHRDARHAAAELVNEFEAAQEVTQQAAKPEPVAEVDAGEDGLFVGIIYGENGSPLKIGDKLYLAPTTSTVSAPEEVQEQLVKALRGFVAYAEACDDDSHEIDRAREALTAFDALRTTSGKGEAA